MHVEASQQEMTSVNETACLLERQHCRSTGKYRMDLAKIEDQFDYMRQSL